MPILWEYTFVLTKQGFDAIKLGSVKSLPGNGKSIDSDCDLHSWLASGE